MLKKNAVYVVSTLGAVLALLVIADGDLVGRATGDEGAGCGGPVDEGLVEADDELRLAALPSSVILNPLVGVAMTPESRVHAWTRGGQTSEGDSTNLASLAPPRHFDPASNRTAMQIVGMAINRHDRVYTWYRNGTRSVGSVTDLDSHDRQRSYQLPPGRTPLGIVGMAISKRYDRVYTWYLDGTRSVGDSRDLQRYSTPRRYTLPPGRKPSHIVGIAIRTLTDSERVYAWYSDGTVSQGTSRDLDSLEAPYPYTLHYRVGVDSAHLDSSGPSVHQGTASSPALTTRDNPAFGGELNIKSDAVTGVKSGNYGEHGSWSGLAGYTRIDEYKPSGAKYQRQLGPVLPRLAFAGPGKAAWETRFGSLVHENRYEVNLEAKASYDQSIKTSKPLHLQLSDDVRLVPIVVISWKKAGVDPTFIDWTHIAKKVFDFVPYVKPPHMPGEVSHTDTYWANQGNSIESIDQYELPPDDIFADCGVQFQMVAGFVFEVPADFEYTCAGGSASYGRRDEIEARILQSGVASASSIVNELDPIYVAYADIDDCESFGTGFVGKFLAHENIIELHNRAAKGSTAHELGHALSLSHPTDPTSVPQDNLMHEATGPSHNKLLQWQCDAVYTAAASHTERFKAFNRHVGRVQHNVDINEQSDVIDDDGPPPPPPMACCVPERGVPYVTTSPACSGDGKQRVDDSVCKRCCLGSGEVALAWPDDCDSPNVVAKNQCDLHCCSEGTEGATMTRYACGLLGGTLVDCPIEPPQ